MGLLIVALVLQGYLSQVHNHDAAATAGNATAAFAPVVGGDGGRAPAPPLDGDGHDLHCFICHLAGVGSAPLPPPASGLALAPPLAVAYVAADDRLALRGAQAAYSSRAPPSLFVPA